MSNATSPKGEGTENTTTQQVPLEAVLSTLDALAAKHPGAYETGRTTNHKRTANIFYSYDDCIAGCVIRELAPDLHEELLDYETEHGHSFSLRTQSDAPEWVRRIKERFGHEGFNALREAQVRQDSGSTWTDAVAKAHEVTK